jgi:hypothetical protein
MNIQHPNLSERIRASFRYLLFFNPLIRSAFVFYLDACYFGFLIVLNWSDHNTKDRVIAIVYLVLALGLLLTIFFTLKK